jgi:hypothetical protein
MDDLLVTHPQQEIVLGSDRLNNWECKGALDKHLCWKLDNNEKIPMDECLESIMNNQISAQFCSFRRRKLEYVRPVTVGGKLIYKSFLGDDGKLRGKIERKDVQVGNTEWLEAEEILGKENYQKQVFKDFKENSTLVFEQWEAKQQNISEQIKLALREAKMENETLQYKTSRFTFKSNNVLNGFLFLVVFALILHTGFGLGYLCVMINCIDNPVSAQDLGTSINSVMANITTTFQNSSSTTLLPTLTGETIDSIADFLSSTLIVLGCCYLFIRIVCRYVFVEQFVIFSTEHRWAANSSNDLNGLGNWWIKINTSFTVKHWFSETIYLLNLMIPLGVDPKLNLNLLSSNVMLQTRNHTIYAVNKIQLLTIEGQLLEKKVQIDLDKAQWPNERRIASLKGITTKMGMAEILRLALPYKANRESMC